MPTTADHGADCPAGADHLEIHVDHDLRRITVQGELDLATVPLLVESAAILRATRGDITIDLLATTFVDAGVLGAMVNLRSQQHERSAALHVLGNTRVAQIAAIGGLGSMITEPMGEPE